MKSSIQYSELTGGLFDVTALPLLELNQESFNQKNAPPASEEINSVKPLVGYQNIKINGNDISLQKSGARITLDGIAVGYIVDKAAELLGQGDINNVLINGGGEIYPRGIKNDGNLLKIGIANPGIIQIIYLLSIPATGLFLTSGDYEAYFTDDYLYNFIIDPRTGVSPTELASATVIAKDTLCADVLYCLHYYG